MDRNHIEHSVDQRRKQGRVVPKPRPKPPPQAKVVNDLEEQGTQYDFVDRRLMDTFPASDAVARY
jgi:hypothetical protein